VGVARLTCRPIGEQRPCGEGWRGDWVGSALALECDGAARQEEHLVYAGGSSVSGCGAAWENWRLRPWSLAGGCGRPECSSAERFRVQARSGTERCEHGTVTSCGYRRLMII
jgi:hypothetical protein